MPVANEGLLTVVALATIGRVMRLPMRTKLPIHFRILVPQESVKCVRRITIPVAAVGFKRLPRDDDKCFE